MISDEMIKAIRAKFAENPALAAVSVTADMPLGPASFAEARAEEFHTLIQKAFPDHTLTQTYQWKPRREPEGMQPAIQRTTISINRV